MPVFETAGELQMCFGHLYDAVKQDSFIATAIRESGLTIVFRYYDPDAVLTIYPSDISSAPFAIGWGSEPLRKPDIEMSMKADIAHQFWHGKINLMAALTRRQIVAKGPIPKILKLLPSVAPIYALYPHILHDLGRDDLILP
ncbi:hypothetical protein F8S13_05235 [Chloroflexia bacterium SDU3-3]|nr:hypothetical protein F8S13_05235 [Chloroflexia bacterium SDU3-3]